MIGASSVSGFGAVQQIEAGGPAPDLGEEANVKRTIRTLASGLAICAASLAFAPQASALDLNTGTGGDGIFLGSVNDGIPSSLAQEAGYINFLVGISSVGNSWTESNATGTDATDGSEFYDRSGNACAACGTATATGAVKDEVAPISTITVAAGTQYILAKDDRDQAGALVWYIGGVGGTYNVPTTFNGHGTSHISAYGGTPTTGPPVTGPPGGGTPEPASLALFGLGLLGAGYRFRRRTV